MEMSRRSAVTALIAALAGLLLTTSTASAVSNVGPNQQFVGVLNGKLSPAPLFVVCSTGHVRGGQTVGVRLGSNPGPGGTSGFTGSAASRIGANMIMPRLAHLGDFSQYIDELLPDIVLPCSGVSQIFFTPGAGVSGARNGVLAVTITPG
jgi:hypothetical protein